LILQAISEQSPVLSFPPPVVLFRDFGDDALLFETRFWIEMRTMLDRLKIESDVRFRIDDLFREAGIVIAFPQRDVHLDTTTPLEVRMVDAEAERSDG
jgi:small-conductance mechanosensitive channel